MCPFELAIVLVGSVALKIAPINRPWSLLLQAGFGGVERIASKRGAHTDQGAPAHYRALQPKEGLKDVRIRTAPKRILVEKLGR